MHAARGESSVLIVEKPPHAAVAAAFQRRVAGFSKRFLATAAANIGYHVRRKEPLAVELALVEHQLADAAEITEARAQTAAREGRALAVDGYVGILLGTHVPPDALRQQLGHFQAGNAGYDPAEGVGVDRLVVKRVAVITFRPQKWGRTDFCLR